MSRRRVTAVRPRTAQINLLTLEDRRVPAVFPVTTLADAGPGSLRQAITDANAAPGADSITFNAGLTGAITLASQINITDAVSIAGPGNDKLTVSGNYVTRLFQIDVPGKSAQAVSLSGLSMRQARVVADDGGAISNVDESLTVSDCFLNENAATSGGRGGAINVSDPLGSVNLVGCTLLFNSGSFGGAVYCAGRLTIAQCNMQWNFADNFGGAVYAQTDRLTIDASTLANNTSFGGGAVCALPAGGGSQVSFRNVTVSSNTATGNYGGGIFAQLNGQLTLANSTVTNNTAKNGGYGGGVAISSYDSGSQLSIISSIVYGNSGSSGPDVYNTVTPTLVKTSLFGSVVGVQNGQLDFASLNLVGANAGLLALLFNGGPVPTHALQAGSAAIDAGTNVAPAVFTDSRGPGFARSAGRTDIGAYEVQPPFNPTGAGTFANVTKAGGTDYTFAVTYTDPAGNGIDGFSFQTNHLSVTGPNGFAQTPVLVSTAPAGPASTTATYKLSAPGGTWDAADNGTYTVNVLGGQLLSVFGYGVPGGANGQFETQVARSFLVDRAGDDFDGNYGPGNLTLIEAIALANNSPNTHDTITFAANYPNQLALINGQLTIRDAVTINGPTGGLAVTANDKSRCLYVDVPGTAGNAVSISNLSFIDGRADNQFGGAIYCHDEALTLTKGDVYHNSAYFGAVAVRQAPGSLTLDRVNVITNHAEGYGGGIYLGGAADLTIRDCFISGNTAKNHGGGIYFFFGGRFTADNSTVSGNVAGGNAGGIYLCGTTADFRQVTVSGNSAGGVAGGIWCDLGTKLALHNCTIAQNTSVYFGGGVYVTENPNKSMVVAESTLIAKNTSASNPDVFGTLTANYSLVGNASGATLLGTSLLVNVDPQLVPLGYYGGLLPTQPLKVGSPAIDAGNNVEGLTTDQRGVGYSRVYGGAPDIGATEVQAPPRVIEVRVNTGAVQRSRVTSLTYVISGHPVFVDTPAAKVSRTGPGGPNGTVALNQPTVAWLQDRVEFTITWQPNAALTEFGSLIDGTYRLSLPAAAVLDASGQSLDGNGDGVAGDPFAFDFHRLFGDADGDRDVDAIDFQAARGAYGTSTGQANFVGHFDSDNDGDVDAVDFGQFRGRFGTAV